MQVNHGNNELIKEATSKQDRVINMSKNKTYQLGKVEEREEEIQTFCLSCQRKKKIPSLDEGGDIVCCQLSTNSKIGL